MWLLLLQLLGLGATVAALHAQGPHAQRRTGLPSITICLLAGITFQFAFSGQLLMMISPVHSMALGMITIAAGSELVMANLWANARAISAIVCCLSLASLCTIVPLEVPLLVPFSSVVGAGIVRLPVHSRKAGINSTIVTAQDLGTDLARRHGRLLRDQMSDASSSQRKHSFPGALSTLRESGGGMSHMMRAPGVAQTTATGSSKVVGADTAHPVGTGLSEPKELPVATEVKRVTAQPSDTGEPHSSSLALSHSSHLPPLSSQRVAVRTHSYGYNLRLRVVVALFSGTIAIARSPASAIAVIKELNAEGVFTQTVLGVTMVSDVVVLLLFSATTQLARILLDPAPISSSGTNGHGSAEVVRDIVLAFLPRVASELCASFLLGIILAGLCLTALQLPRRLTRLRQLALLLISGCAFAVESAINSILLPLGATAPRLEPMLACIVTGFIVCNGGEVFTGRDERQQLDALLHEAMGPTLTFFFFTTGLTMRLSVLLHTWPLAILLVGMRLLAIYLGHTIGARAAGMSRQFLRHGWLAYVTQAGMSLGLASEIAREFGQVLPALSSTLVSAILLNQLIGPPLLELAIRRAGEARDVQNDRDAAIEMVCGEESKGAHEDDSEDE